MQAIENPDGVFESLKLSIQHEEQLVAKAIETNSCMNGIKWYYKTYRPDDYKRHKEKRDWTKNCKIRRNVVFRWMQKFKETGYHRPGLQPRPQRPKRPKTGVDSETITLSEYQKNLLVSEAMESGVSRGKTIKAFVKVHFPNEYINFEIYNDWDQCSITRSKLSNWINNVQTIGCLKRPVVPYPKNCKQRQKLSENLRLAKSMIEEIKNAAKGTLDLANGLSASMLAGKMGISRTTANKYLNILERHTETGDSDTGKRNDSSASEMESLQLYPDSSNDEETIEIDTGEISDNSKS